MAFIPGAGVIEAEVRMLVDSQKVENTLYFKSPYSPVPATPMANLGAALLDWWGTSYATLVAVDVALTEIYLTDLTTDFGSTLTVPADGEIGTISGASLPNNATFCVSFRTARRGRSYRGRNYLAALAASGVVKNTLEEAYVTNIVTAYEALITLAGENGFTWVVASRQNGGVPRDTIATEPITTVVAVDRTVDSQRRRLPGRGT